MKTNFTNGWRCVIVFLVIVMATLLNVAHAQLPDCTSGNTMYVVFNNAAGSTTADSMEIRPVNLTTGAIGNLMGGKRYWIRKQSGGGTWYYGSAGLGVDLVTNRFYVMTQMSPGMQKDIITINPVTGTQTVIASTPTSPVSLNNYHFVKLAVSPNGYGYAIGVHRDSNATASTFNPLIRFNTCGAAPTTNCATVTLLGYLPSTGNMYKWKLFNGDIAFDIAGNLYFATAAFEAVNGLTRYTDARLFRINVGDLPSTAGTGTIPMNFVAEYNSLDSTVINGIGLDGSGNMFITTRRFLAVQSNPPPASVSELYRSTSMGLATVMPGFAPITTNFAVADLGSCYFPTTILNGYKVQLQHKYESGHVNLKWHVNSNSQAAYFEVQRSNDGNNYETIATIQVEDPTKATATYTYSDPQSGVDKRKFYRIRQVMRTDGWKFYSNVVNVSFTNKMNLSASMKPNPFVSQVEANVWLRSANTINVRLMDQSGRVVYSNRFAGKLGDNRLTMDNLGHLRAGVYMVELAVQDEVIREKLVKQ